MPGTAYDVLLTEDAVRFIEERVTNRRSYARILDGIQMLAEYPRMGRTYDPEYADARVPFPCRRLQVSDTPFALYYVVSDDAHTLTVFYLEFSAGDPQRRFSRM